MQIEQIPIGKFSKFVRLTPKALKLYEQKEILVPHYIDTVTGYRYYSSSQIETGMRLSTYAWAGFSLEEMKKLVDLQENGNTKEIQEMFQNKLDAKLKEQEKVLQVVDFLNKTIENNHIPVSDAEITVKDVPDLRVASARETGTYDKTIGELIKKLMKFIFKEGRGQVTITGPIMFISHDKEYKEEDADIEIAIPIQGTIKPRGNIEIKTIPGRKMLSIMHKGSYDTLTLTYQKMHAYLKEKNLEIAAETREVYLTNPKSKKPSDNLTELQFPYHPN